jgi:hypothetical protein
VPKLRSYEGVKVGNCCIVGEAGPKLGRRTTHFVKCGTVCKRFLISRVTIQQAIKKGNSICRFCERQRPSKRVWEGQRIRDVKVIARLLNGNYPGGRSHLRYEVRCCTCGTDFVVNGEELCRALNGDRLTNLCTNPLCPDAVWPVGPGHWQIISPATPPSLDRKKSHQRWWNIRCTAASGNGSECGNERLRSTSDLNKKNASRHCGCLRAGNASEHHAARRLDPWIMLVKKLMKGVRKTCRATKRRPEIPFSLSLERCSLLYSAPCVYCGAGPFQETNVEIIQGKGRKALLGRFKHGGLDRVWPRGSYIEKNAVPACKHCNMFKGGQTAAGLSARLRRVVSSANNMNGPDSTSERLEQLARDRPVALERLDKIRSEFCSSIYRYITMHLYRAKSAMAKQFGRVFELTQEQFVVLCQSNCFYCGVEPSGTFHSHTKHGPKCACCGKCRDIFWYNGLDRIDSQFGYALDNVVPCCPACNRAKQDRSVMEFLHHCRKMLSFVDNWEKGIDIWTGYRSEVHE